MGVKLRKTLHNLNPIIYIPVICMECLLKYDKYRMHHYTLYNIRVILDIISLKAIGVIFIVAA